MLTWKQLVHLPEEKLAQCDIAEVNLACAADLPDAARMDAALCLRRLDEWADGLKRYTAHCYADFVRNPQKYQSSEPYFRALCLATFLQRGVGVRYNPAKIPNEAIFHTEDTFIFGILQGPGGTCGTLPIVYIAVGRRLGYPLKLAYAKTEKWGHLYCRWDDGKVQMNIETTGTGLCVMPDSHYRTEKHEKTDYEVAKACLCRSLTPREELSTFLHTRGLRWKDLGRQREAVESLAWAHAMAPHNRGWSNALAVAMDGWGAQLNALCPPGFPPGEVTFTKGQRFPGADDGVELNVYRLEVLEKVLSCPPFEQQWWGPMRRREPMPMWPVKLIAKMSEDVFDIRFETVRPNQCYTS